MADSTQCFKTVWECTSNCNCSCGDPVYTKHLIPITCPDTDSSSAMASVNSLQIAAAAADSTTSINENLSSATVDFGLGQNWVNPDWPYLTSSDSSVAAVLPGTGTFWFDVTDDAYVARGHKYQLQYNLASDRFLLLSPNGTMWRFIGFSGSNKGRLASTTTPDGRENVVQDYTDSGHPTEFRTTFDDDNGQQVAEASVYEYGNYIVDGEAAERVVSVTLKRQPAGGDWQTISITRYEYGDDASALSTTTTTSSTSSTTTTSTTTTAEVSTTTTAASTASGNLRRILYKEVDDSQWTVKGYYRYYDDDAQSLKYSFATADYVDLRAALGSDSAIDAADDNTVAAYAGKYFEYDSTTGFESFQSVRGGQSSSFEYLDNPNNTESDYNQWKRKTTTTTANGVVTIDYVNYVYQPLFRERTAGTDVTYDFWRYDSDGNLTSHADSEAVASVVHATSSAYDAFAVTLSTDAGRIDLYEYYTATTAADAASTTTTAASGTTTTAASADAGVKGYKHFDKIQHGTSGTPIYLKKYEYAVRTIDVAFVDDSSTTTTASGSTTTTAATATASVVSYPVWRETVYPAEATADVGGIVTQYDATYYAGAFQRQTLATTYPAISTDENGNGISAGKIDYYDASGNLLWSRDELGRVTHSIYDVLLGVKIQEIRDVNSTQSAALNPPSGFEGNADGLHLVSDFTYDIYGRMTESLGPAHAAVVESDGQSVSQNIRAAAWNVYDRDNHETRSASGYQTVSTGGDTIVNPVGITRTDDAERTLETVQTVWSGTQSAFLAAAADDFPQSADVRRVTTQYDSAGRVASTRTYFNLACMRNNVSGDQSQSNISATSSVGVQEIPVDGDGAAGVNYGQTSYGYDTYGRRNMEKSPGGRISRTVYDLLGNAVAQYLGTNDAGATDSDPTGGAASTTTSTTTTVSGAAGSASVGNDMVLISEAIYAGGAGCTSCGGGGAGQLITAIQHVDASTTRATNYSYDWRDRRTTTATNDGATDFFTVASYDNLDRATDVKKYHTAIADANLTAFAETFYDARGRVYRTKIYSVDASTGAIGDCLTSNSWFDAVGNEIKTQDALGRATVSVYDALGRVVETTLPAPNEDEPAPQTQTLYDAAGNVIRREDRLGNATKYDYDPISRQVAVTDPNRGVTRFAYDKAGNLLSLTDPVGNRTDWRYDAAGRMADERSHFGAVSLGDLDRDRECQKHWPLVEMAYPREQKPSIKMLMLSRRYQYDLDGNLVRKIDRNSRKIDFSYDFLGRRTAEVWKNDDDTVNRTISYTFDRAGDQLSASDPSATYNYTYDGLGRPTSTVAAIVGLTPTVTLAEAYNTLGARSLLSTTIGTTADLQNAFSYDGFGRMASIIQSGVSGGNTAAEKRVDFAYDAGNQFSTITRYADAAGTKNVAASNFTFDGVGRLIGLSHAKGTTSLRDYSYEFDLANRMIRSTNSADGTLNYTNDAAGQLTGADLTNRGPLAPKATQLNPTPLTETLTYDLNGNRTNAGFAAMPGNRLLTDGTYTYTYDYEGNCTAKFRDRSGIGCVDPYSQDITTYEWDHRNRLVRVVNRLTLDNSPDLIITYAYDAYNRWLLRQTWNNNNIVLGSTAFVYDGNQILVQFDNESTSSLTAADLSHRYLVGPTVDQHLADEQTDSLTAAGAILWPLCDHLNTVRDLAIYNSSSDTTTIVNHRVYNSFGLLISETNYQYKCLFAHTGRPLDIVTRLQNHDFRWYQLNGYWLSEDPIRYKGGINLYRYCDNNPLVHIDPSGLLDLSPFTCAQLSTALAKIKGGLAVAQQVAATGKPPWQCGGTQAGNPTTGAEDPVEDAIENALGYAVWDLGVLGGGTVYWFLSAPIYKFFYSENDRPTWWTMWGLMEMDRHQRFIDLIQAEMTSRCPPPPPPCKKIVKCHADK